MSISIPIINKSPHAIPRYATALSAGVDLVAWLEESIALASLERKLISTGLYVALPEGYEAQIRPRSGFAFKEGITVLNSPGTIDADYRGEIKVLLVNLSPNTVYIRNGDRIAQMVIATYSTAAFELVSILPETERGAGGFGSTGKNVLNT